MTIDSALNSASYSSEDRETTYDMPLLLPLLEQYSDDQRLQRLVAELARHVSRLLAERLPVTIASPLCWTLQAHHERILADLVCATLTNYLNQGFQRLLLVPWGSRQHSELRIDPIQRALSAMNGELVSLKEMALPPVHVDGISSRSAFGGLRSLQKQLGPLLESFPGWDQTWTMLSTGQIRIMFMRSSANTVSDSHLTVLKLQSIKALTSALCPQQAGFIAANERARLLRDGEMYAQYLVSLLCSASKFLLEDEM